MKNKQVLSIGGYYLDSVEDWNLVEKIPKDLEFEVISYFNSGFNHKAVAKMLPAEYKWIAEFISMYHESYL